MMELGISQVRVNTCMFSAIMVFIGKIAATIFKRFFVIIPKGYNNWSSWPDLKVGKFRLDKK